MSGMMERMASAVSMLTGFVFAVGGAVKVFDMNKEITRHMKQKFMEWAQVSPLRLMGVTPNARMLQHVVGLSELLLGAGLLLGSRPSVKRACSVGLIIIMAANIQACVWTADSQNAVNPVVFMITLIWIYFTLRGVDDQPPQGPRPEMKQKSLFGNDRIHFNY